MHINQKRLEYWKEQIRLWEKSNLNQSRFCRQNNIDEQLFSKWKIRLLKQDDNKIKLVKIPFKLKKDYSIVDEIELIINEKYKIKIHSGFDQNTFKRLIETIEG